MNRNKIITSIKSIITNILILISNIIVIIIMHYVCSDFNIGYWYNAIFIVIAILIANTILWPIFRRIFVKFMILTFGIGALLMNSIIFYIVSLTIPNVTVGINGFIQVPLVMAMMTTFIINITNTNYYENYVKHIIKYSTKKKKSYSKRYSGLIMIEIDGLSKKTLEKAIKKGAMPTLKRWLNKSHALKKWETDLSSQTGASQAGILHGNNKDIVAYRWVEKENNNKIITAGKLSHAQLLEKRISNGKGLLVDGISITNMFSGDSITAPLTSSKIRNINKIYSESFTTVFLDANNFQRLVILFLWDIIIEIKSQIIHKLKNIRPRLRRTLIYATIRAGANVILREVTTEILTGEIFKGEIDTAYATYMGYDEVAHHSGVEDNDVWNVLKQIDLQIKRLESAIKMSDRNYEIVILSDHGQSNGATFKQRYGISLRNYVRRLLPDNLKVFKNEYNIDHFRDTFIPENQQIKNIREKMDNIMNFDIFEESEALQNIKEYLSDNKQFENLKEKYENSLDYIKGHESLKHSTKKAKDSELIVLGSGNLGLIYLTQWKERLNYEEIVLLFPDLIPGLVKHSGVGFLLVNSIANGPMVIGSEGIYYLDSDKIIGKNPLMNFGKNANKHLKRQNSFKNMPDILVNSFYDTKNDEVCAFEELIGSHGGLGGEQTKAFILYPSNWTDPGELIGAESIYKFLKKEIKDLKNS